MPVNVPHLGLPFHWETTADGTLAAGEVEQESTDEIAACGEAILRTVEGQRTTLPEFGRPEVEFNTDPEAVRSQLASALIEWEPRVQALIDAETDEDDLEVQTVRALLSATDTEDGS